MGQRKTTTRFNITDYWGKTSKLRWILHFRLEFFFFFALITHNTHLWFQYSCHGMQKVPMKLCEKQTVCTYDNVYLVFKIDKCITIVPNEQPMNWRSGFTSRKIKKIQKLYHLSCCVYGQILIVGVAVWEVTSVTSFFRRHNQNLISL